MQASDDSGPLFGFVPQRLLDVTVLSLSFARCVGRIRFTNVLAGAPSLRLARLPGSVSINWMTSSFDSRHGTVLLPHASMQTRRLHQSADNSMPMVAFDPGWKAVSSVVVVTFPFSSSVS
jgi:hypothetical protein